MSVQFYDEKNLCLQTIVLKSKILANTLKKLADKHHYLVRLEKRRRRSFPERAKIASDFVMVLRYVKKSYRSFLQDIIPFLSPEKVPNIRAQPKALEVNAEPKAPKSSAVSKDPTSETKSKTSSSGTKLKKLSSKIKPPKLNPPPETEAESERKVHRSVFHCSLMPGRHFLSALHSITEWEQPICNKQVLNCKKELEGFFGEVDLYSDDMPNRHFLSAIKSKPERRAPLCEPESFSSESEPESLSSESEPGKLISESDALDSESEPEKVYLKPINQPKVQNSGFLSRNKSVQEVVNSKMDAHRHKNNKPEALKSKSDPKELRHRHKPEAYKSESGPKELRHRHKPETHKSESDSKELRHRHKSETQKSESKSQALRFKSKAETLALKSEPKAPKHEDKYETLFYESESEAENFKAAREALNTRFETEIREVIAREKRAMRKRARKVPRPAPQKMTPICYRPEDGVLHYDAVWKSVKARRPIGLTSKADRKEFRRQMRCLPQDSDSSPERGNISGRRVVELYNIKKPNSANKAKYPPKPTRIKK